MDRCAHALAAHGERIVARDRKRRRGGEHKREGSGDFFHGTISPLDFRHLYIRANGPPVSMNRDCEIQFQETADMNHDAYADDYLSGILKSVKTIALTGASPNPARPSNGVMGYLLSRG